MYVYRTVAVAFSSAAVVVLALAAPVHAATPIAPISDAKLVSILTTTYNTGTISEADRNLLATRPEIASLMIDPTSATPAAEGPGSVTVATVTKTNKDRYINYFAFVTHEKLLEYHFTLSWSHDGKKITGAVRDHYLKNVKGPGITDDGFTNSIGSSAWMAYNTGNVSGTGRLAAKWHQCVLKVGCLGDGYPLSIWQIYANGGYNYTPYP